MLSQSVILMTAATYASYTISLFNKQQRNNNRIVIKWKMFSFEKVSMTILFTFRIAGWKLSKQIIFISGMTALVVLPLINYTKRFSNPRPSNVNNHLLLFVSKTRLSKTIYQSKRTYWILNHNGQLAKYKGHDTFAFVYLIKWHMYSVKIHLFPLLYYFYTDQLNQRDHHIAKYCFLSFFFTIT